MESGLSGIEWGELGIERGREVERVYPDYII